MKGIREILIATDERVRKTLTISIDSEQVEVVERITKEFTKINNSNKSFSRNDIIVMAIEQFIEESKEILLEDYGIDIYSPEEETQVKDEKESELDLVILPARSESYKETFVDEKRWYAFRMKKGNINRIKYLSLYISSPESAVLHYAPVVEIRPYPAEPGKYEALLEEPITLANKVILGKTNANAMRSPRYTTLEKLLKAHEVEDLF